MALHLFRKWLRWKPWYSNQRKQMSKLLRVQLLFQFPWAGGKRHSFMSSFFIHYLNYISWSDAKNSGLKQHKANKIVTKHFTAMHFHTSDDPEIKKTMYPVTGNIHWDDIWKLKEKLESRRDYLCRPEEKLENEEVSMLITEFPVRLNFDVQMRFSCYLFYLAPFISN
mgnify:CR=1 FL=1